MFWLIYALFLLAGCAIVAAAAWVMCAFVTLLFLLGKVLDEDEP